MGFFKKLKDRLFTLDFDAVAETKKKEISVKEEKVKKAPLTEIEKQQLKVEKKLEKENLKRRKKEKTLDKYVAGLSKSGSSFAQQLKEIQSRYNEIDEEFFEELEEVLIMSDISVKLVMDIIDEIKKEVKVENITDPKLIGEIVADKMFTVYTNNSIVDTELDIQDGRINVMIMVGVNGAGKTTTIAKIANRYIKEGKKVLIAAGDTFRAGAVQQLGVWAERIGADIIKPQKEGADPASVVYDAVAKAKNDNYDLLIIDTAGKLQNKVNLMNELENMHKII